MFSFKYQLFLNDLYYWGITDILTYFMGMTYLETLNYLLNTHTHVRFNQRSDRLYIDINWDNVSAGEYLDY